MQLLGRERERAALNRLVESARDGYGGALVFHGGPGVGKTALLDDSVEQAATLRIVRTAGVESEMELPFAAVQRLCASILAFGERLPRPQRDALDVAFGLSPGPLRTLSSWRSRSWDCWRRPLRSVGFYA